MPSLRSYRRLRSNLGPSPLRNTRFGRLIRSPLFRRANYAASAVQAAGIARRAYLNYKRSRATKRYREVPFTTARANNKKRKVTPPHGPGSTVPKKHAVAPRISKVRKLGITANKTPKSAIVHYKEYGLYQATKCMYINHEHWGNVNKFWQGIAYGLTKKILAYGQMYCNKSMEDPILGPRTKPLNTLEQYDDKLNASQLRLIFTKEGNDGASVIQTADVALEVIGPSPDQYRSFDDIATDVATQLKLKYQPGVKTFLKEAQILRAADTGDKQSVLPIYIPNLDDAEIHLYVKSLIKLQNQTPADHGSALPSNYLKDAIDANPIHGRVYSGKGHYPRVDGDLMNVGNKTLGNFFGDVAEPGDKGITLLGWRDNVNADDLARIAHIPTAGELYGNQSVKTGNIRIPVGGVKYHGTTFTYRKTFRQLAGDVWINAYGTLEASTASPVVGRHTLFGFTNEHRHGIDNLYVAFQRDVDVGCYIKHKRIMHSVKTAYTKDNGLQDCTVVPTDIS